MHGQQRLPPGVEAEEWFQAKLAERNAKVSSFAASRPPKI